MVKRTIDSNESATAESATDQSVHEREPTEGSELETSESSRSSRANSELRKEVVAYQAQRLAARQDEVKKLQSIRSTVTNGPGDKALSSARTRGSDEGHLEQASARLGNMLANYKQKLKKETFPGVAVKSEQLQRVKADLDALLLKEKAARSNGAILRQLRQLDKQIEQGSMPWVSLMNLIDGLLEQLGHAPPPSESEKAFDQKVVAAHKKIAASGTSAIAAGQLDKAKEGIMLSSLLRGNSPPQLLVIADEGQNVDAYLDQNAGFLGSPEMRDKVMLVFDSLPPGLTTEQLKRNTNLPKEIRGTDTKPGLIGIVDITGCDTDPRTVLQYKYDELEHRLRSLKEEKNPIKRTANKDALLKTLRTELEKDGIDAPELLADLKRKRQEFSTSTLANKLQTAVLSHRTKTTSKRKNAENLDDARYNQAKMLADFATTSGKTVIFVTTSRQLADVHDVLSSDYVKKGAKTSPRTSVLERVEAGKAISRLSSTGYASQLRAQCIARNLQPPVSIVLAGSKEHDFSYGKREVAAEVDANSSRPTVWSESLVVPFARLKDVRLDQSGSVSADSTSG